MSEEHEYDGPSDLGIVLIIGMLTMVFSQSWQMFAAAGVVCVGCLAVRVWGEAAIRSRTKADPT